MIETQGPQAAQRAADEQYARVEGIRRKWEIGDRARVAMDGRVGTVVHVFPGSGGTTTLRFPVEGARSATYTEGFSATQLRELTSGEDLREVVLAAHAQQRAERDGVAQAVTALEAIVERYSDLHSRRTNAVATRARRARDLAAEVLEELDR